MYIIINMFTYGFRLEADPEIVSFAEFPDPGSDERIFVWVLYREKFGSIIGAYVSIYVVPSASITKRNKTTIIIKKVRDVI